MGILDYYNNSSDDGDSGNGLASALAKYKPTDAPKSRNEVLIGALQKLAADQQLGKSGIGGGIAQGLAGFVSGDMQGKLGDQQQAQQMTRQQALGGVFDRLSQGDPNGAIGGLGGAARAGLSAEDIARFKDILKPSLEVQTTRDARGNPVFASTANAIGNNLPNAPQQATELKNQNDAANDQIMRQQGQQRLGIEGANLNLRQQELQRNKAPSGYTQNQDGTLSFIPGGPADPSIKVALRPLPSNATKQLSDNNSAMSAIDNALKVSSATPDAFGLMGGLAGSTTLSNNQADPKNVMGRAAIADIGSKVMHDRSGAAVTISEAPRLKPFIPSAYDSPEVIKTKLTQLRQKLGEENQGLLDTYDAQGYNINDKLKGLSTNQATPSVSTPAINEGMTATNPQTGQKVVFKNGAWSPVQ